eukprot:3777714-Rhodomonas_salina.1
MHLISHGRSRCEIKSVSLARGRVGCSACAVGVRYGASVWSYAFSSTEIAYGVRYGDRAYRAIAISLRACYAVCGTEIAYGRPRLQTTE